MAKNLIIQLVSKQELPLLLEIAKSTFINTYAHLNDPQNFNEYLSLNFNLEKITQEFNNSESAFFFVKKENKICGYLKLNWGNAQTDNPLKNAIEIERIYVLQEFQGQQIGKMMVNEAIKLSKSKSAKWLWLGVWERNPKAIGFYKKMGFEAFGEHAFIVGQERQIDVIMKQRID